MSVNLLEREFGWRLRRSGVPRSAPLKGSKCTGKVSNLSILASILCFDSAISSKLGASEGVREWYKSPRGCDEDAIAILTAQYKL